MPVTFNEDPEDLFIFYNNIDKERIKKTLLLFRVFR
jgi:hypothetical protein